MKVVFYVISGILIFFGVLFIWGAFGTPFDGGALIIGLIMVAIGLAILIIQNRKKNQRQEVVYKVDLGGDVNLKNMTCKFCGGPLSADNVKMLAGTPTVTCPFCNQAYQITEEPKW